MAKEYGHYSKTNVTGPGIAAVERMITNRGVTDNDELSYLLYIYSLYGKWNHDSFKQAAADEKINPYMAANLLKAAVLRLKGSPEDFESKEINEIIVSLKKIITSGARNDSSGLYWPARKGQSWNWPGGNTEITAHVLSALILAGDKSSLCSQAFTSLSKRFKDDGWMSTKETGTAVLAMSDYLKINGIKFSGNGNLSFSLDGKGIAEIPFNVSDSARQDSLTKEINISGTTSADAYKLSVTGDASEDTTFSAVVRGFLYFKPQGLFSFMKSEKRSIRSLSNGISARRDLFYLTRVKDMKMQEYLVPQSVEDKGKIITGDELLVRVKFRAEESFGYMVLEDFLPSGFEVVNESAYNEYQPYSHLERRDNRMVFFFTGIEKDKEYEIAYIIRAELPGSFIMRPARVECMYEQTIQGWTLPTIIDVQGEK
jgi:hypothetical protein